MSSKEQIATAFVVELPWDLGVPDDLEVGPPALAGRGEEEQGPCWLRFRTVEVPAQLPLAVSDLAFGDLAGDEASSASERQERAAAVKGFVDKPFLVRRTVAVVYVQCERELALAKSDEMADALRRGLKALNDFLVSLGVLFNDRIRPISIDELPLLLPVMSGRRSKNVFRHGPSQLIPFRSPLNETQPRTTEEMQRVERMLAIVSSGEGLASFYEIIQRAGSARRAGRHREAAIDYATAGEIFITTMLSVVGERLEMEPSKLANILAGPFKDRALHLCRLLDLPDDPEDGDSPLFFWWMHCYQQRNGIVHRGADSMALFSEGARIGLVQLVVDIREAVRRNGDLADLGALILWGRRIDHTGGDGNSEPDPLPPLV
ncbi:MAG TPA: hypothetical protein VIT89_04610 [Solirubrobacterales bacterium]